MSRRLLTRVGMVLSAGVMVLCSCSTGPVTGTETGNPDITACLTSALSLFDSTDEWLPSTYLVDGERQLSPNNIYTAPAVQHIAKRAASDSAASVPKEAAVVFDTVFVVDTIIIRDTIVLDTAVLDTVPGTIEGTSETNVLIFERIRYDSIFIVDTQVVRDTFLVSVPPSATNGAAWDGARGNIELDLPDNEKSATVSYTVLRDSLTNDIVFADVIPTPATQPVLVVRSDSVIVMVARKVTIGGVAVSEVYRDADGNGKLNNANAGAAALLTCTGFYTGASTDVNLVVDFDAGADAIFSTTGDNRIHSLLKKTSATGRTEQVRYGERYFGQSGDTAVLLCETDLPADTVARMAVRYVSRTGTDPLDHRMNTLVYCQQTISYRTGSVREIELTVTPVTALAAGKKPTAGTLSAMVDFGKGLTGRINAVVDYSTGSIVGTYAQAGTEYSLEYHRTKKTPTLLPLP